MMNPCRQKPKIMRCLHKLERHCQCCYPTAAIFRSGSSESDSSKHRLNRVGGSDVLPVFCRIIIEGQHEILVPGQAIHCARIFRAEPFNTVIKCFVSLLPGFCLPDIVQGFLDLGLHGFGQFLHNIGRFMYPAALLISFWPEPGHGFPESQSAITDSQFGCVLESSLL